MAKESINPQAGKGESASAPQTEKPPWLRAETFVTDLPKWRDGVLVLAGVVYVLGYLSWAFYSQGHELGFVPISQAQYFAAGFAPAVILALLGLAAFWFISVIRWTEKPISPRAEKLGSVLASMGVILVILGMPFWIFPKTTGVSKGVQLTGWSLVVLSAFFSRAKGVARFRRVFLGFTWVYLLFLALVFFAFYVPYVFPYLPTAFGGPGPECVQLDVDLSKVSTNTWRHIAPTGQANITNRVGIMRTKKLDLIAETEEYLVLRAGPETSSLTKAELYPVFKIKRKDVDSVWVVRCWLP